MIPEQYSNSYKVCDSLVTNRSKMTDTSYTWNCTAVPLLLHGNGQLEQSAKLLLLCSTEEVLRVWICNDMRVGK